MHECSEFWSKMLDLDIQRFCEQKKFLEMRKNPEMAATQHVARNRVGSLPSYSQTTRLYSKVPSRHGFRSIWVAIR